MNSASASFWDHVEELRMTLIRILLVVSCGFFLSLIFHDVIIEVVTLPLRPYASSKVFHTNLVRETVYRQRIRNTSDQAVPLHLEKGSGEVVQLSPSASRVDEHQFLLNPSAYVEVEMLDVPPMLFLFGPLEGVTSALRLCFWSGLTLSSPLWMFFVLRFVGPGLKGRERRILFPFMLTSLLFLVLGVFFSLTVMIPIANRVLHSFNSALGQNMWGVGSYLNYTVILMLGNGVAFELVVVIAFLVHYGLISSRAMREKRKVMIVAIFIVSAILTPPDILTQCLLAVPLTLLYELAILYAQVRERFQSRQRVTAFS